MREVSDRPAGRPIARRAAIVAALAVPLVILVARRSARMGDEGRTIEIHARMPESGGWSPEAIAVAVGEPVRLRLTSDDVMHGFAVGRYDGPEVDVRPGEFSTVELTFDRPGKYVFYCTRWCGVNHWRMRGTIEVTGEGATPDTAASPLYLSLGIDLDAPHEAEVVPGRRPSAVRGAALGVALPDGHVDRRRHRTTSPVQLWRELRRQPAANGLGDADVWDLVAAAAAANTDAGRLERSARLYAANCAACHGEAGGGDGVMASALAADTAVAFGHAAERPADFSRPDLLGASPALLHGKIVRGGMGTGMPYWGPILTDDEIWTLVEYLWTFQFDYGKRSWQEPEPSHKE